MNDTKILYNEGKLLVRAMDWPQLKNGINGLEYDCTAWANEFCMLMNEGLSSASSTLIVHDIGVSTYKNIGFLINSDLANCFHISKSDSGSSGNIKNGDFFANKADFRTIIELENYIKTNNDNTMNEVNIEASIDSVVGLVINECLQQDKLLQMIYVVKNCLENITGIDYPIYLYNSKEGKINKIELTDELEQQIIRTLKTTRIFYWPDEYDEPIISDIEDTHKYTR
ncbi:MAG: hypothetical protein ACI4OT_05640 [Bacilli bacterium]